jgi:hypothetical protein
MAWRVARSLDTLLAQFNSRYPDRSKASDGSIGDAAHAASTSDHNPWVKDGPMGVVTARDFTHDPAHGMDIDRLTDELAASRDPRIKYVIANGYILDSRPGNRPWQWVRYTGANQHNKHFHLSVMSSKALYDDARPWNIPSFTGGAPAPTPIQEDDMPLGGDDFKYLMYDNPIQEYGNLSQLLQEIKVKSRAIDGLSSSVTALTKLVVSNEANDITATSLAAALNGALTAQIGPIVHQEVAAALGQDNSDEADKVSDLILAKLGEKITASTPEGE